MNLCNGDQAVPDIHVLSFTRRDHLWTRNENDRIKLRASLQSGIWMGAIINTLLLSSEVLLVSLSSTVTTSTLG